MDAAVGKKKRKLSESQLKALAAGRKKRWTLKNSPSNEVAPIAEVRANTEESEANEEIKVTLTVQKVREMSQEMIV